MTAAPTHVAIFGGDAVYMRNFRLPILLALKAQGHRVTAICPDDGKIGAVLAEFGVNFAPLPMHRSRLNPVSELRVLWRLLRLLRREKVDVLLAYTIKPIIYGLPMAWLAGVGRRVAMVTGIGYALMEGSDLRRRVSRPRAKLGYRVACSLSDRVIFQNPDDRDLFLNEGLLADPDKAVLVAGSGVDLQHFAQQPLPDGPMTFVMVGRLLRDKGVHEYVAAARLVRRQHPEARFLLVGGTDDNPSSVTPGEVEEWVASGAVEHVGHVDDVRPYLAAAHVFVLPSYREGTPRSGLEAMATGRAIVTTDAPGCREVVRPGVNGLLVPVANSQALAEALLQLCRSPQTVAAMGAESRRFCEERFDVALVTRDIVKILMGEEVGGAPVRAGDGYAGGAGRESRPRVLHVVASSWAIPFQILPLAEALVKEGWEVDVASAPGAETAVLDRPGMRHLPIPIDRRFLTLSHFSAARALVRILREGRYNAVHLHGPLPSVLGRITARMAGVPVIYHCRGTYYEGEHALLSEKVARLAYPPLEWALGRWTYWTFTLTPQDAADLVAKAGLHPERVESLGAGGCGLDLDTWSADRYDDARKTELRARFGVPEGRRVIGFVGRLVQLKGVFELLDAFIELRRTRPDLHLLVVGDTEAGSRDEGAGDRLKRLAAAAGVADAVTFTGHLPQPTDAVALMDILALPSYWESFGQVLAEAGGMGIPVVATDTRGARFAVVDGQTGILVPPRDAAALGAALARLLDDPALAARLGAAGLARAREFGRERVIRRMLDVYDGLLIPQRKVA